MGHHDFPGPQIERMWKNSAAEGGQKPPTKRRKRKASTAASENNSKLGNPGAVDRPSKRKASPITSGRGSMTTDVMLVGEPTLMGGEFGAEDERIITRLENAHYNASNGVKEEEPNFHGSPVSSSGSWPEGRKGIKEEKNTD